MNVRWWEQSRIRTGIRIRARGEAREDSRAKPKLAAITGCARESIAVAAIAVTKGIGNLSRSDPRFSGLPLRLSRCLGVLKPAFPHTRGILGDALTAATRCGGCPTTCARVMGVP
jgi:hypothetical protein